MKHYKLVNNLCGWFAFAIAAVVYCLTIEPTASFWDCPEFITTGYKLEIGHPPGAPFFMLMANLFTQFTNDVTQVARMVNTMSALMSATCILFLFWSITHLTRKLLIDEGQKITTPKLIAIMGSGMVGALAYTFSDTFWFSAVEGEVYAFSSLFTAAVFWLILKWEECADEPHSDRWLVFIAYLTGISIGVHLLNLLCIPAIVLVYYFKKHPHATAKGSLGVLAGSFVLVAAVLYGIVPGIVKVGGWFELLFVNTLGFDFNTGLIVYIAFLIGIIVWGVYESYTGHNEKRMKIAVLVTIAVLGIPFYGHGVSSIVIGILVLSALGYYLFSKRISEKIKPSVRLLNTTMLCVMMIVIGYSSYAVIVIRSAANTPMDQNSPEDIFSLGTYLNREQYGTRPLFYGESFASQPLIKIENGQCMYVPVEAKSSYSRKEKTNPDEKDKYIDIKGFAGYEYAQNMLFPRMYSQDPRHIEAYKSWTNFKGHQVPYDQCGQTVMVTVPTQWENLKFFLSYQVNFMYWRYFMWNFSGRQNDLAGSGELEHGNWITGFNFIDNLLVGNQSTLPDELKNNKGHNVFYCMPLILGILGLLFQAYRKEKGIQGFWVVFFLFFMTGLAIVIYLNQTPMQPRERDYAYAGSFYAFAIWIGMGVAAIYNFLTKKKMGELPAAVLATAACLCVPIQMASQTWDDHDRSIRYVCRDFGQNYLYSCQMKGNPTIFTNGDNDTFPLWYCQETEGIRTDMKVCNLSYLQTDWYIDQMKRPSYGCPGIPISWNRIDYEPGTNEMLPIRPDLKKEIEGLRNNPEYTKVLGEDPFELKNILSYCTKLGCIPTDSLVMTIDKEAVLRSGMMIPDSIPDKIILSLKGKNALTRSELMVLDMVAQCNWVRPLYIALTVGPESHLCFSDYLIQEGLAYRFTPFQTSKTKKKIDTKKMYENVMTKFRFGNVSDPKVYLDENVMRMCYTHRRTLTALAVELFKENEKEKSRKVLDYCLKMLPTTTIPLDYRHGDADMATLYYQLGNKEKANELIQGLFEKSVQYGNWYLSLSDARLAASTRECLMHMQIMMNCLDIMQEYHSSYFKQASLQFENFNKRLEQRAGILTQNAAMNVN